MRSGVAWLGNDSFELVSAPQLPNRHSLWEGYLGQPNRYALWKGGDEATKVMVGFTTLVASLGSTKEKGD